MSLHKSYWQISKKRQIKKQNFKSPHKRRMSIDDKSLKKEILNKNAFQNSRQNCNNSSFVSFRFFFFFVQKRSRTQLQTNCSTFAVIIFGKNLFTVNVIY